MSPIRSLKAGTVVTTLGVTLLALILAMPAYAGYGQQQAGQQGQQQAQQQPQHWSQQPQQQRGPQQQQQQQQQGGQS